MNLQRGFVRLVVASAILAFVFWTCAYVLKPYSSLQPGPASFLLRATEWSVLGPSVVVAIVLGVWIAAGLRSKE